MIYTNKHASILFIPQKASPTASPDQHTSTSNVSPPTSLLGHLPERRTDPLVMRVLEILRQIRTSPDFQGFPRIDCEKRDSLIEC
jgi:hypothetical protein